MRASAWFLPLLVLLFSSDQCQGRVAPPEDPVARSIRQLGDADFMTRERAARWLLEAGDRARPALRAALHNKDPEVVRRARAILTRFKTRIPPGTPEDIASLLRKYHAAEDRSSKVDILQELFGKGGRAYGPLLELLADDEDADVRREADRYLRGEAPAVAAFLIANGKFPRAEQLLADRLDGGGAPDPDRAREARIRAARDYAAFQLFRGNLRHSIRKFEERSRKKVDGPSATVLAFLYRADGDLANARRMARAAGLKDLEQLILAEQKDWGELASLPVGAEEAKDPWALVGRLGQKAAYLRLSGKVDELTKTFQELRRALGKKGEKGDSTPVWRGCAALLLNDRPPDEVFTLLKGHKDELHRFELLCAQLRFREALALEAKDDPPDPRRLSWFQLARARALMRLGERAKAKALMEKVFRGIKGTTDLRRYWFFLEAEYRMGLGEGAVDHFVRLMDLAKKGEAGTPRHPWWALPPEDWLAHAALTERGSRMVDLWYDLLTRRHGRRDAVRKVGSLLAGRVRGAELAALLGAAEKEWLGKGEPRRPAFMANDRQARLQVLAETCLAAGRTDLARRYWEKAVRRANTLDGPVRPKLSEPCMRLGDHAAGRGEWRRAAGWYGRAWEDDPRDARPYYLSGEALARAGRAEEGRRRKERARELPLGNEGLRYEFARALGARGQTEAALREYLFLLRTGTLEDFYDASAALAFAARAYAARGEHAKAAAFHERVRLLNLRWNLGQVRSGLYLTLSHRVRRETALAHLGAGRLNEDRKEIRACQELLPGNVDLPIACLPALERKGLRREADTLFKAVVEVYEQLCADHPRCDWSHHNLAWLAVSCRREPGKALKHAEKAVELDPENALYLDTLAEVHFQRGDRAKAVALGKRALARDPGSRYLAAQLRRFQAGKPGSALPAEVMSVPKVEEACLLATDLLAQGASIRGPCLFKGAGGSMNVTANGYSP